MDGDCAAGTPNSAADSGCFVSAGCSDSAAVDGDCAAGTTLSAADSGCESPADCLHCAAVNGDGAAGTATSADPGCITSAGCLHCAAVDDNIAAATILTTADSGSIPAAGCGDTAAVDGDCATRITKFAADSGYRSIFLAGYGQRTHVFLVGLGINGKTVALCHIDAVVDGQACAVCQNQVNLAADGDAAADGHITFDHIPACTPCDRAAFHHSDIICCLFTAVFVQIGNAVLRQ